MPKPILLIDDDELVLQTLGMLLESQGYRVEKARNGFEAIEKAQAQEFALVISDIRMPGMDGIELIQRLRDVNHGNKRKPVPEILITAYADENAYLRALKLNVTDYFYKPFDMDQFLATVEKRIRQLAA
jgi:CheY-like chemotaxis protein